MIRPTTLVRFAMALCTLLVAVAPLFAQTATEYSDKDKKKLGEIAQRPEVLRRIQDTWDARRRRLIDAHSTDTSTTHPTPAADALPRSRQRVLRDMPPATGS